MEDADRPTVANHMVHRQEQKMIVLRDPDEACPEQRAGSEIEGLIGLGFGEAAGLRRSAARLEAREIAQRQWRGRPFDDLLHDLATALVKSRSQDVMSATDLVERQRQGVLIERSGQLQ